MDKLLLLKIFCVVVNEGSFIKVVEKLDMLN